MTTRRKPYSFPAVGVPVACALAFTSLDARANGRLPTAHELVFSATNPNFVAIEATFGLFLSQNAGADFGWVCEPAIGYPATLNWDPPIGITSTSVLAGIPASPGRAAGVSVSMDQGCSWEVTLTAQIVDLVVRRDDPHSALALASSYSGVTDAGGSAYLTQVFATHDDGATWPQQGVALEPDVAVETIDIAQSDPNTIYVGGARTVPGADGSFNRVGIVLGSTNGGASYTTTEIPLLLPIEFESSAFVSAVDPNDPQRVYVRVSLSTDSTASSNVSRLLVSDDGAATFRTVYQSQGALPGFALSSDGTKVFLGDSVAGVLLAPTPPVDSGAPYSFTKRSPTLVECLTWSGGNLYACAPQSKNPYLEELAVSKDDGMTFSPVFPFGCVSGAVACDSDSGTLASTCGLEFPSVQALIGPCPDDGGSSADGGAPDASPSDQDAGAETSRPRASSCGCEAGEAAGEVGGLSAMGLIFAMVLRRRRRA
jgi:MYXO-CTERM domain-containing protein